MRQLLLPGLRLKDISVFDLTPGIRILDKTTGKQGFISDVRETTPEVVEAFIKFDGSDKEHEAWRFNTSAVIL